MITGLPPGAVRAEARRLAAPQSVGGNALPSPGREPPAAVPAAVAPPDRSRSIEVLDRFLSESQRSLQFLHDPDARRTVILIVHPGTGEVLRQIPARERLALAQWIAPPAPPVIDLSA